MGGVEGRIIRGVQSWHGYFLGAKGSKNHLEKSKAAMTTPWEAEDSRMVRKAMPILKKWGSMQARRSW